MIQAFETNNLNDTYIVDCHMHLGKPQRFCPGATTVDSLLHSMKLNHISLGCISSLLSIGSDPIAGNSQIEELMRRYPDKFIGAFGMHPAYPEELPEVLDMVLKNPGFKIAKVHKTQHCYMPLHKTYQKLYEFCIEHQYPVLAHVFYKEDMLLYGEVASAYPELKLIIGHCGGHPDSPPFAIELANKYQYVYLDYTKARSHTGLLEWMVKETDHHKIFFGSDAVFNSQSHSLGQVIYAQIPDQMKIDILCNNFISLLRSR